MGEHSAIKSGRGAGQRSSSRDPPALRKGSVLKRTGEAPPSNQMAAIMQVGTHYVASGFHLTVVKIGRVSEVYAILSSSEENTDV